MNLYFDDQSGQRTGVALDKPRLTVGRSSDCDLVLADDRVSRVHAYVDNVAGQHLLQDAGSSNGTFLNGMRLRAQASMALREGDVVEIGNTRFLYADSADRTPTPASPLISEISDGNFPLNDLLRDGWARAGDVAKEERSEFLRAFVGVSPVLGLERCLDIIARRVGVDAVAVFMKGPNEALQAVAWRPGVDVARSLAGIARRAWTAKEGRLIRGFVGGEDLASVRETAVRPLYSAGAVPFLDGDRPLGVLAVERVHEKRLDRVELAQLAAMGDSIAQTLALGDRPPGDTSLGAGGDEQDRLAASGRSAS